MKRQYTILKLLINLIIFGFALSFEGASPERTTLLVLLFAAFVAWGFARPRLKKGGALWYAIDAALIFLLEYQSKYLVNYFFHILYISAMVEAGMSLDRKRGNTAAVILSVAALSKYIQALHFGLSASILSQLLFNLFALAFLITLINFGKLQQEERDKSQRLYKELVEAYHRLEELSAQKERAAALEERNRIARDMHDSLGHRLTSLIMQIEMGKEYLKKEPGKTDEYLDRCADNAREALTDTRRALRALGGMESSITRTGSGEGGTYNGGAARSGSGGAGGTDSCIGVAITDTGGQGSAASSGSGSAAGVTCGAGGESETGSYTETLESIIHMIEEFSRNTGIEINYKLPDTGLNPIETTVLYRVIQEAITNAARHGKATRIDIEAGLNDDGAWFCIQNNGEAGGDYTEGFGLSSMRKRLEDMGGSLKIETGQGFKLNGRFKATGRQV
ncbi:MAG TPA: sensor histidine kinase [Bacillota bacterium]|jgi:signal transduction histidine kinase|nr:sensor histidine kinase [Bacillota bacterium]HQA47168.1 sensor histidine kinase [Bacillota bacterium]HQD42298.1 sensor histidine kinase [Bacillota bacterium]